MRKCTDYGIIHRFGRKACLKKEAGNLDVLAFIQLMEETCGVNDMVPRIKSMSIVYFILYI